MGRMEVSAHLVGPQELEEVVLHVGMVRSAMDSNLDNWVAVNKDLRIQNIQEEFSGLEFDSFRKRQRP